MWLSQDETDEEKIFRDSVKKFVSDCVNPLAAQSRKDYDGVCRKIHLEAGKAGILGLSIPQKYGGQGAGATLQGIAREELGRGRIIGYGNPWPLSAIFNQFAELADPSLEDIWLPKFIRGEASMGLASTEPRSGSDVANTSTTAIRKGSGFVIDGEKGPISGISARDAYIVLARTGAKDSGARGVSAFFVEADRTGLEKTHLASMEESADLGLLKFDKVEVPADHLIGAENKGFQVTMTAFDSERAVFPMSYLGATMDSIELSIDYTKNRSVWGRPIATFEGVMFPLVEAVTKVESIRSFCYRVLRDCDSGKRISEYSSMVRWYVTRVALDALDACIQVNGAQGYTDTVPHQRRYRWVRAGFFGHGTLEIQKLVIGRAIFGNEIYDVALGRKADSRATS